LLQRRGVAAWVQAWPNEENDVAETPQERSADSAAPPATSSGQVEEITRVLVDIILEQRKEAVS
jgi:hypothetical protein